MARRTIIVLAGIPSKGANHKGSAPLYSRTTCVSGELILFDIGWRDYICTTSMGSLGLDESI